MICLSGVKIIDPANHIDGDIGDLWIEGDRIVAAPPAQDGAEMIDARGWIAAPGGIEIHSHIAGAQMAMARKFAVREDRMDAGLLLPPAQIAQAYLKMGYTTVFDAAMSPMLSRLTQDDLKAMRGLDCGAYTLVSEQICVVDAIKKQDDQALKSALAWLLTRSGGYALKLVNPGVGLAWWMGKLLSSLDDALDGDRLTQRRIILAIAQAAKELSLPHPIHLHAGNLGRPGSWQSFCETVLALEGLPAHLCHIQFYCYGKDDRGRFCSAAEQVVETIAMRDNLTFDVGQIVFGPAMALTCDLQLVEWLHRVGSGKWTCRLLEGEGGMGLLPLEYKIKDPSSAVQWATGLELLLRFPDPTRLFLSTDYPNGGPFIAYPRIISWLMDGEARQKMLAQVHPSAKLRTSLADIDRQYTLTEVVQMTSAGPARALGLQDRGHLGAGALADIRCYQPQSDIENMFANPILVIKRGQVVLRDGQLKLPSSGNHLSVEPDWDKDREVIFKEQLQTNTTIDPRYLGWLERGFHENREVIPCR